MAVRRWLAALGIGLVLLTLVQPTALVFGNPRLQTDNATITVLEQSVTIISGISGEHRAAVSGDVVSVLDRIRTAAPGRALITFFDGSELELEPGTEVQIQVVTAANDGGLVTQLAQSGGITVNRVAQLTEDGSYQLQTPNTTAMVRGTVFRADVQRDPQTNRVQSEEIQVTEGEVEVRLRQEVRTVRQGETLTVQPTSDGGVETVGGAPSVQGGTQSGGVGVSGGGNGLVIDGVDDDPENQLFFCSTARVPFGSTAFNGSRCITFRYQIPSGGITSARLHLDYDSIDSTDGIIVATSAPFSNCNPWGGAGAMPGCVGIIGGPLPAGPTLDVNLLDIVNVDAKWNNTPESQALVTQSLDSGVLHLVFQDDSPLYCMQLVLNGGGGQQLCDRNNSGGDSGEISLGNRWQECESSSGGTACGTWLRQGGGTTWNAVWEVGVATVTATLIITQNGDQVTVERSDPNGLLATYVGTLSPDGASVNGTVTWCCDGHGTRSGTWEATIHHD